MKDPLVYLEDILNAISKIRRYIQDYSEEDFSSDEKTQDAVIREISIIGEVANSLDQSIKDQMSVVPWRDIIGMRNILIHDYKGVLVPEVWKVIQSDLTPLFDNIQKFIHEQAPSKQPE